MPMPKPGDDESKKDFLSRCMGDDIMVSEYEDEKQRYAICNSLWEEKGINKKSFMEARSYPFEVRTEGIPGGESVKIVGYAAVYNQLSDDLGGFKEKIKRGFFAPVINNDVRALFNHDNNYVLGRTKNETLKLEEDNKGLKIEIIPPDTTYSRDLINLIQRGDVDQMSFQFVVGEDSWDNTDLNNIVRTLVSCASLLDVSPVTFPAYPQTKAGIASRSAREVFINYLEEVLENDFKEEEKDGKWQERISILRNRLMLVEREI